MIFRKTFLVCLALAALSATAMAQDSGNPDSIKLAFVVPPVVGTNVPIVVECSVKVDADLLGSITMAWKWDNNALVMDSAVSQGDFNVMDIRSFYLNDVIGLTNDSNIALCSGVDFGSGFPVAPGWRRIATYYMHATNWSASSFVKLDTIQLLPDYAATEYLFVTTAGPSYQPNWGGPVTVGTMAQNLIVNPTLLNKVDNEGGGSPAADSISVGVDAGGSIGYNLTENISWLSLSKSSGNTPDKFAINYNTSALAPGVYSDSIQVTSAQAANSPVWVKVNMTINAVAKFLDVSPDSLQFSAQEGGANPASQSFAVTETGGFVIAYNLSETASWINLNKAGGNTPDSVSVSIDITGLAPGTYIDSVQALSGAASNSPIYERIRLTVNAADKFLDVNPDTLKFSAQQGGVNPSNKKFAVTETGGSAIVYTLLESAGWISLDKLGGNTPDSVTVSIDLFGLNPAVYLDSIQVSSASANNSPVFEYVSLEVTAPTFLLDVTPDSLTFNATEGGSNPSDQNFGVIESSGGNIAYTLIESEPWLTLNKAGGNTPDVVTVSVDISGLAPGTYYGNVQVSSDAADNSPIAEVIKLVITALPRNIVASPNSLGPSMNVGGPVFDPITVHVTDTFNLGLNYTVSEDISWLNISPSSGTTPDSFWVIADTIVVEGLAPGFYLDTITITSGEADNSPIYVYATLEVNEVPNNPPVIAPIDDYTIDEGDFLTVSVMATDADGDPIYLFHSMLPANAAFFDSGNGNGYFTFAPNYSQAGDYLFTAHASDLDDTTSESFTVHVLDKEPGTEGDTLHIGTVPAVPGQQVVVPVEIANSCNLHAVYVPFTWNSDNVIYLDSIKFNEGLLAGIANRFVTIDNDSSLGLFGFEAVLPEVPIPTGHYHLADMYFSVSPVTPHGVYAITPGLVTTTFTRNCSDFGEIINPVIPGGGGNIIVDTTNVYVCGYVVDEDGVGIWGAQVELWENYPCEGPVQTTWTNGDGAYAFTNFSLGSFDLYAWKRGNDSTTWNDSYYPNNVHVNFGENGIMIELPWLDELVPSDQWVDYFCSENTYFNCALPVGSIVEVWDEDNVLCGRQFVRESGVYRFLPVYRDSSGSAEDEGAVTGDNLRFYINGDQALTYGNTIYPEIYTQLEVCLAGGARLTKECLLNTGWNLVSWNLDTDTDAIEEVLSSLDGCIEVVLGYEQGGLTYVPGMDIFNTLNATDHLSGYWIKLGDACNHTLEITGVPVEQDTPIPVNSRWNLVSYLPNDVHSITDALYSLDGNLQIAYTYDGTPLVYVPGQGTFNTLTEMEPCFGYWLKLDHAGVLTYPSLNGIAPKVDAGNYTASLSDKRGPVETTRNWVNLYSYNLTLDGRKVNSGDIITAHSANNTVIGHFAMKESGTFGFMPVYADADGESAAGITKGGTFTLQVNGTKTKEEFTWTEQGGLIEVAALTTGDGGNNLPESYVLEQNYPNPFNPSTTINFSLPVASQARLEIFNLLGQLVATPFDAHAEAGAHEVVWDGRTFSGETASSGIYLYRLTAGQYVKTLKMTLVK